MAETAKVSIDDTVLVRQWQHGDCEAMERLILKYQSRLYNVILKICGNADDAAELTQQTFVKVIENIGKFQRKSGFYTWAFRIAVNLTLNYCKRSVKLGVQSLDADHQQESGVQLKKLLEDDSIPDPAEVAQNKELCQLIITAMNRLDDGQRTVLVLRDIEGMNYAQIAKTLELPAGTVKSRLSRARSNLREMLEGLS